MSVYYTLCMLCNTGKQFVTSVTERAFSRVSGGGQTLVAPRYPLAGVCHSREAASVYAERGHRLIGKLTNHRVTRHQLGIHLCTLFGAGFLEGNSLRLVGRLCRKPVVEGARYFCCAGIVLASL